MSAWCPKRRLGKSLFNINYYWNANHRNSDWYVLSSKITWPLSTFRVFQIIFLPHCFSYITGKQKNWLLQLIGLRQFVINKFEWHENQSTKSTIVKEQGSHLREQMHCTQTIGNMEWMTSIYNLKRWQYCKEYLAKFRTIFLHLHCFENFIINIWIPIPGNALSHRQESLWFLLARIFLANQILNLW